MIHFVKIENEIVTQCMEVNSKDTTDKNGLEKEEIGSAFCSNLLGGIWKKTSTDANFRKNYAALGYTYDNTRDAFIPIKPYASWILDEETCKWKAPVDMPTDDKRYLWDEETKSWDELV